MGIARGAMAAMPADSATVDLPRPLQDGSDDRAEAEESAAIVSETGIEWGRIG